MSAPSRHRRLVLNLYRSILRRHKLLPPQERTLGDSYVKSEFRRHQEVPVKFIGPFLREWASYLKQLIVAQRANRRTPGRHLEEGVKNTLAEEHIDQLESLKAHATGMEPKQPK